VAKYDLMSSRGCFQAYKRIVKNEGTTYEEISLPNYDSKNPLAYQLDEKKRKAISTTSELLQPLRDAELIASAPGTGVKGTPAILLAKKIGLIKLLKVHGIKISGEFSDFMDAHANDFEEAETFGEFISRIKTLKMKKSKEVFTFA